MTESNLSIDVSQLDSNMSLEQDTRKDLQWFSPQEAPFYLAGFAWMNELNKYRRLPHSSLLRLPVDQLANCTAGGQIRFQTNSKTLSIRVKLAGPANMVHMPATGQCGFDCYIGQPGSQRYFSTTLFDPTLDHYECILFKELDCEMRNITLNFPLYQAVDEVWIGLEEESETIAPPDYCTDKKIIVYGTSITQGGCATRPGMLYTNILSRRLPYEFINLGFSGNGKGEPELAQMISSIPDPGLLVLDYEANVSINEYAETLPEFIRIYREQNSHTPILIVSKIRYADEIHKPETVQHRLALKQIAIETIEQLQLNGDEHIYYQDGESLLGDDYDECTVDSVHPTDLGFLRMSDCLEPVFKALIEG